MKNHYNLQLKLSAIFDMLFFFFVKKHIRYRLTANQLQFSNLVVGNGISFSLLKKFPASIKKILNWQKL